MTKKELRKEISEAMKDSLDYQEGTYTDVLYDIKEGTFSQGVNTGNTRYADCITVASINGKNLSWLDYLADDVVTEAQNLLDGDAWWIDYPIYMVRKAKKYVEAEDIDVDDMDRCEAEDIMVESGAADLILKEYKKEWTDSEDWQRDIESYVDYAIENLNLGLVEEVNKVLYDYELKDIPEKIYKSKDEVLNTIKKVNADKKTELEDFLYDYENDFFKIYLFNIL